MSDDSPSGGSHGRRKLALNESYVATIGPMVGGGIFAALALAVEIAGHLVVWRSQNRLSGLPIAGGEAVTLGPGRFSLTQLQVAKI